MGEGKENKSQDYSSHYGAKLVGAGVGWCRVREAHQNWKPQRAKQRLANVRSQAQLGNEIRDVRDDYNVGRDAYKKMRPH